MKDRINLIIQHKKYREYINRIAEHEKEREFCRHDMTHFLDVCRLGEILYLRNRNEELSQSTAKTAEGIDNVHPLTKLSEAHDMTEFIYAAGLLHDIGRFEEYEQGIRHELASAQLAPKILSECGFEEEEIKEICLAIRNHRNPEIQAENHLSGFLYRADKMSRPCFACRAEAECDWSAEKKNVRITY